MYLVSVEDCGGIRRYAEDECNRYGGVSVRVASGDFAVTRQTLDSFLEHLRGCVERGFIP